MREMKILRTVSKPLVVLVALLTATGVVTALSLFTHTFPSIGGVVTMTTACGPLSSSTEPSPLVQGGDGQATFDCGSGVEAFTVSGSTSNSVIATPTYSAGFAAPYTTLFIYNQDGGTTTGACSLRTGAQALADGSPETIPGGTDYNYCAAFEDVGSGGLPTFTVTWTA